MKRKIVSQQLHNCAILKGNCQIKRNLLELAAHFSVYQKRLSFKIQLFVSGPHAFFLNEETKSSTSKNLPSFPPSCPKYHPQVLLYSTVPDLPLHHPRGEDYCAMARISHFGRKRKGENCIAQKRRKRENSAPLSLRGGRTPWVHLGGQVGCMMVDNCNKERGGGLKSRPLFAQLLYRMSEEEGS